MANILLKRDTMNSENNDAKKQATPADRKKVGKKILVFFGWIVVLGMVLTVLFIQHRDAKAKAQTEMISKIQTCAEPTISLKNRNREYKYDYIMEDKLHTISRLSQSRDFSEIVLEQLDFLNENGDFEGFLSLVEALDYAEYQDESIKEMVAEAYQAREDELFRDADSILDNKAAIATLVRMEYYFDGQVVIDHLKENARAIIIEDGKGGYYDTLHDKYEPDKYNVDPLGIGGGGVGTYTATESYAFYGDFLRCTRSKKWYGTSAKDDCNSSSVSLEFRGQPFPEKFRDHYVKTFDIVSNGMSYYIEDSEGEYLILAFTGERLKAIVDSQTIYAYHDAEDNRQYIAVLY